MILHLFPKSFFTDEYVYFINKYFDSNEHRFLIFNRKDISLDCLAENNVFYYPDVENALLYAANHKKLIQKLIIHCAGYAPVMKFLLYHQDLNRQAVIVFWGADFYGKIRLNPESVRYELEKTLAVRRSASVVTLIPQDYSVVQKRYRPEGCHYTANYPAHYVAGYERQIYSRSSKNREDGVYIQIGNNAAPSNNHLEVLRFLKPYAGRNIKLIVPLSYGDSAYAKKVVQYGRKAFPGKFFPILKLMDHRQYSRLLNKINVAVFNNNRQQGMGNIESLLYLGSKVYMRNTTTMYQYYTSSMGCRIIPFPPSHKAPPFEKFISCPESLKLLNHHAAEKCRNINAQVGAWQRVFNG